MRDKIKCTEYIRCFFVRIKGDYIKSDLVSVGAVSCEKIFDGETGFVTDKTTYNQLTAKLADMNAEVITVIEIKE